MNLMAVCALQVSLVSLVSFSLKFCQCAMALGASFILMGQIAAGYPVGVAAFAARHVTVRIRQGLGRQGPGQAGSQQHQSRFHHHFPYWLWYQATVIWPA